MQQNNNSNNMFQNFSVDVIDPMNRTGKISIPVSHIQETRGLHEYCDSVATFQSKDFSLCLLYQRGSCRGGNRCHQIHASPSYVESLREKARASRTCCALHGDLHSDSLKSTPITITILREDGEEARYNLESFGRTAALDNLLRVHHRTGVELRVASTRLCRLHSNARCKFGKDCKNVHLCPQATELAVNAPAACFALATEGRTKRSPSLDGGDCGVSSIGSVTPRGDSALLDEITVAPLMQWKQVSTYHDTTNPLGNSEFTAEEEGFSVEQEFSSLLDMSAFEATMQTIVDDLERAEFSPNTAVRVKSNCNLLSLRE